MSFLICVELGQNGNYGHDDNEEDDGYDDDHDGDEDEDENDHEVSQNLGGTI